MKWQRILALVTTAALATPLPAGIFFGKKKPSPVDPTQRVPELLNVVKTSPDEHKRSQAAEELRKYDPQAYPDIVPVLIDVLASDPKPSVRVDAAQTLGKLRPVSQAVGQALEQALAKDASMRVRLQARSSLLQYHWSGYRTPKKDVNPPPQTKEPPLAPSLPTDASLSLPTPPKPALARPGTSIDLPMTTPPRQRVVVPTPGETLPPAVVTQPATPTSEPSAPLIRPTPIPMGARPLPAGPAQPPVTPAERSKSQSTPSQPADLSLPPRW